MARPGPGERLFGYGGETLRLDQIHAQGEPSQFSREALLWMKLFD